MEAQRQTGFCASSIASCASGKNKTSYGFIWKFTNKTRIQYRRTRNGRKIVKLDENFNLIKIYNSITETCSSENFNDITLTKYIKLRRIYKGYYWMYYENYLKEGDSGCEKQ